jgi:Holliday junction resolvase RusA-like endonuclease
MKIHTFAIAGPLLGYRASVRRAYDPAYRAYKDAVRLLANTARVPRDLDADATASVHVTVHWKRRARIDATNVLKAVEDALWGRDRRVMKSSVMATEHEGVEQAIVSVEVTTPPACGGKGALSGDFAGIPTPQSPIPSSHPGGGSRRPRGK